ncbi:PEP-CTERM sorting domain-containing protein [Nostoc sp. T09]|uniref:PEP-CTERM sorting domain-containing protein n=1 Tax=Nostoc sp. T09 TaxID=1932621 RepID=UPI0015C4E82E|nr:PEP-CTERM sorting domain-containing protein [Nostoc sp. T09]
MNFKSIGLGIALTCGTLTLGSTVGVSQAQAATVGSANFAGLLSFKNQSQVNPDTETLYFSNPGNVLKAKGIFAGSTTVTIGTGNPYSLLLNKISNSSPTSALYTANLASITDPFLTFSNGIKFQVTGISNFLRTTNSDTTSISNLSIAGKFYNGVNAIADGAITAQQKDGDLDNVGSYSYSIVAKDVPEPLTILGSATALGFGTVLKKKYAKKQSKEKVMA